MLALARGFRYAGPVVAARPAALIALLGCLLATGCKRGAKTPEEAFSRFSAAVKARDGQVLYEALDLTTRWSYMSLRRAHREAYDIVLSNFPEGPARESQMRRFEAAALSENEAALFASQMTPDRWEALAQALPGDQVPPLTPVGPDEVRATTPGGRPLVFRKGQNGRWGYAGFSDEAEGLKRRASADLELVRTNAADLERAATRAGK